MTTLFLKNPRLLALTIGFIVIAGVLAFYSLPRMEDPMLTPRAATITTILPGADAERMEALVTEKIEEALKEIEEIKEISSTSRASVSFLGIELKDDVDAQLAHTIWSRIRDKATDAHRLMPPQTLQPEFERLDVKAYALVVALRWAPETDPAYGIMRRLLKQLRDRIEAVPGTEKTRIFGDPQEEILVTIQPAAAAAMQLNAKVVSSLISASDSKVPAGQLRNQKDQLLLEVSGELDTLTRLSRTPIQLGDSGSFVELSDIAIIEKSIRTPQESRVLLHDRPGIALAVLVENQTQLDAWTKQMQPLLSQFEAQLPPEILFETVFEQNRYVSSRLMTLYVNLLYSAVAIFLVILIMMGLRSAMIVSCAVPLCCLLVLVMMHLMGIPIHQMSVVGLIISLGLMVDNAIVTVDEIQKRMQQGCLRSYAVADTLRFLAIPLLGSTLTTVFSFAPIALMPGPSGEFVGSIATVTIIAITASLFVSLTVIAAVAGLSLKSTTVRGSWLQDGLNLPWLTSVTQRGLMSILQYPAVSAVVCISLPVLGFVAAVQLEEQFFPPSDRNQFQIELDLPGTSSIAETELMATRIRHALLQRPEIQNVAWFLGESAPVFYYNLIPDRKNSPRYGQAIVDCSEDTDLRQLIQSIQMELDADYPGVTCLVRQLEQGPPFSAPIEVQVFGPDKDVLRTLGDQIRLVLTSTPHVIRTRSDFSEALPQVTFAIDEQEARIAGLNHQQIASELNSLLEGETGGSILESTEELPIRVRVSGQQRGDLNEIASMSLLPTSGNGQVSATVPTVDFAGVPLSAISTMELNSETGGVERLNGRRMNELQAFITAGVLPSTVLKDFKARLAAAGFSLPDGYELAYAGAEAERDDAVGSLVVNTVVLISMMVVSLVLSLRSFRLTALLFLVAGLSVGLGLGSLWLAGLSWGFMSIVGMMGMIGITVNDSIVVLAALTKLSPSELRNRRTLAGCLLHCARHVLATTFSTIVGFAPLIIGGGEFWPPVAIAISGGVLGATVLAMILVPCLYLLIHRRPAAVAQAAAIPVSRQLSGIH